MTQKLTMDSKIASNFKNYLTRVAATHNTDVFTYNQVMLALDLTLQKQRLTTLEEEFIKPKKSKIDLSGDSLEIAVKYLIQIASYDEGDTVGAEFDEPHSARLARIALSEINEIKPLK